MKRADKFVKDICKIVGHEFKDYVCKRCGLFNLETGAIVSVNYNYNNIKNQIVAIGESIYINAAGDITTVPAGATVIGTILSANKSGTITLQSNQRYAFI